jgi:hypothetical protein
MVQEEDYSETSWEQPPVLLALWCPMSLHLSPLLCLMSPYLSPLLCLMLPHLSPLLCLMSPHLSPLLYQTLLHLSSLVWSLQSSQMLVESCLLLLLALLHRWSLEPQALLAVPSARRQVWLVVLPQMLEGSLLGSLQMW